MQGHKTDVATLFDVTAHYLKIKAVNHIIFEKYEKREKKWVVCNPPMDLIDDLMALAGDWKFQNIVGVISTPTMRPNGTILSEPGYDPATRLLMINPPELPDLKAKPSRDDAFEAIELLEDLICEFPLVDGTAKAVALAAMITPVVRGAFLMAPMFVNKAPTPASGKSYLFDVVAAIAIGQRMPTTAAGQKDEETEKRLGASLLAGQALINIDNIDRELGGDAICQYLERPVVNIRYLGKSENRMVETSSTTFYATGNNIVLVGDIIRRALICTLDPNEEQPEQHVYKKKPYKIVLKDRGKYIAACLTICKAYWEAGMPDKAKPLASYEEWSDVVRSAIMWLGRADCVESMKLARLDDPRLQDLEAILTEWQKVIGTGEDMAVTLNKVIALCNEKGDSGYAAFVPKYQAFYDVICRVASSYGKPPDLKRFGNWASKFKGRLLNGVKLVNKPGHGGVAQWWVQHGDDPKKVTPGLRHVDDGVSFNEHDTSEAVRQARAALDDAERRHDEAVRNGGKRKPH
jgi:hypothetical protein